MIKSGRMKYTEHAEEGRQMHSKLWSENLKTKDQLGDLRANGKIILKCILGWECVDCIHLLHNMNQWRALVTSNETAAFTKCGEFFN
jgi:hypothetical protein